MGALSDFLVFADASGDHGMASINPDYPIFVLSCCIFQKIDYVATVCPEIQRFKMRWWQHDAVVLHTAQIKRQERPFVFLKSAGKRDRFLEDLNATIAGCPFTLIAGVIHKAKHQARYHDSVNPYALALQFCMERVFAFLKDQGQQQLDTTFLVEQRGRKEDAELELVFRRVCDSAGGHWG